MNDERWDIEADVIYYFNSVSNKQVFTNDGTATIMFSDRTPTGGVTYQSFPLAPA